MRYTGPLQVHNFHQQKEQALKPQGTTFPTSSGGLTAQEGWNLDRTVRPGNDDESDEFQVPGARSVNPKRKSILYGICSSGMPWETLAVAVDAAQSTLLPQWLASFSATCNISFLHLGQCCLPSPLREPTESTWKYKYSLRCTK